MADQKFVEAIQQLQAVCLFAGDIVPTTDARYADLGWRSGRRDEVDKTGPVFSYERVLAAAAIHRMNPSLTLVVSGGNTNVGEVKSPPISTVVSFELCKLGVRKEVILEEPKAFTAHEQLINCNTIIRDLQWTWSRVAILAPVWQLARISAMIAGHGWSYKPRLLSMERALAAEDEAWNARFAEWYAAPDVREMFAKEVLGVGQLLAGHQPKYPRPYTGFADPL